MRASLLLVVVAGLAACGGKVTVDQGTSQGAGGSSSNGPGAVVGSSVASGISTNVASVTATSTSSGGQCDALASAYATALANAQACSACENSNQCGTVTAAPICGCPVPLNGGNQDAINQAQEAFTAFQSAGCEKPCPPIACVTPAPGETFCMSDGKSCNGACQFLLGD